MTGENRIGGRGGMVSWHVSPFHWRAHAWCAGDEFNPVRRYKNEDAAKRVVEKWLSHRPSRGRVRKP